MLAFALAGWVDSATWHSQSVHLGREPLIHVMSMWGECELILMVDWDEPDSTMFDLTRWELRHRPVLRWYRQPWLAPEYRGHHTPDRLQLFTWFSGDLHDGYDLHDVGDGLFGNPATLAETTPVTGFTVELPYWFVVLLTAVLPGLATFRALRSRRRGHMGQCGGCGYNLTGNVSGVCPECGAAAGSKA
jgi:hypothetical protein